MGQPARPLQVEKGHENGMTLVEPKHLAIEEKQVKTPGTIRIESLRRVTKMILNGEKNLQFTLDKQ